MPRWDDIFEHMASYVLLDGLVGNTDRHHENWMIAYVHHCGDMWIEIMPSYDHASSLGRELTDEKRQHILNSDGVHRYLNAGRGAVYVGPQTQSERSRRCVWPVCCVDGDPSSRAGRWTESAVFPKTRFERRFRGFRPSSCPMSPRSSPSRSS